MNNMNMAIPMTTTTTMHSPPMPSLVRKRSWTEMSYARTFPTPPTPKPTAFLTAASASKKNKRVLGPIDCSMEITKACCCVCVSGCAVCCPPLALCCPLSEDAQKFLLDNPFDELPPHPVLQRQHAIYCAPCPMMAIEIDMEMEINMETESSPLEEEDEFMMGDRLGAILPLRKPTVRFSSSIVGNSLHHPNTRGTSILQQRRM